MSRIGAYACKSAFVDVPGRSLMASATSSSTGPDDSPVEIAEALAGGDSCNRR